MQLKARAQERQQRVLVQPNPSRWTARQPAAEGILKRLLYSEHSEMNITAMRAIPSKVITGIRNAFRPLSKDELEARKHEAAAEKNLLLQRPVAAAKEYDAAALALLGSDWKRAAALFSKAAVQYLRMGIVANTNFPYTNADFSFDNMLHAIRTNEPAVEKEFVSKAQGLLAKIKNGFLLAANFEFLSAALHAEGSLLTRTDPERSVRLEEYALTAKMLERRRWTLAQQITVFIPAKTEEIKQLKSEAVTRVLRGEFAKAGQVLAQIDTQIDAGAGTTKMSLERLGKRCTEAEDKKNEVILGSF